MSPTYTVTITNPSGTTTVQELPHHNAVERYLVWNLPGIVSAKITDKLREESINVKHQGWTVTAKPKK